MLYYSLDRGAGRPVYPVQQIASPTPNPDAEDKDIIPPTVSIDFCLAYFKDTALYIFILGKSRVIMKRGEKLGVLLEGKGEEGSLNTASGHLQNNDTIILETNQFANNISDKHLNTFSFLYGLDEKKSKVLPERQIKRERA